MTIPSDRRVFVRALLPGAIGLVIPAPAARSGLVRGVEVIVPIPYTDLPTGAGSWNTGGGLITITNALTVSGLLAASAGVASATDIYFTADGKGIRANTADGSDTLRLGISGGGALFSSTRGANIDLRGNEFAAAWAGSLILTAGDAANAFILMQVGTASIAQVTSAGFAVTGTGSYSGLLTASANLNATGSVNLLSGGSSTNGAYSIGRTSQEGHLGVAGNAGAWATGAAQGDVILRSTVGDLWISAFANKSVKFSTNDTHRMTLTNAAFNPASAGGLTLGASSLPWGTLYVATDIDFRSTGGSRRCGWSASTADRLGWSDSGGNDRLEFKYTDGQPLIGLVSELQQLAVGNPTNGGCVLVNGVGYNTEAGDVLVTGSTATANGHTGEGHVKIRTHNGSTATVLATFKADGTVLVGAPTGTTITGAGKVNVAGDVYKNGSAYTNPDYVFETAYNGAPRSPAPESYRIRPLAEVEQFTKEHLHLPGISREASGVFARADMLLEKVEELYLHAFDLDRRIKALEAENQSLKAQVQELTKDTPQ